MQCQVVICSCRMALLRYISGRCGMAQVREAAQAATVAGPLAARITCEVLHDAPALAAQVARGPQAGRAWLAAALIDQPDLASYFHEVPHCLSVLTGAGWPHFMECAPPRCFHSLASLLCFHLHLFKWLQSVSGCNLHTGSAASSD